MHVHCIYPTEQPILCMVHVPPFNQPNTYTYEHIRTLLIRPQSSKTNNTTYVPHVYNTAPLEVVSEPQFLPNPVHNAHSILRNRSIEWFGIYIRRHICTYIHMYVTWKQNTRPCSICLTASTFDILYTSEFFSV